MAEIDIYIMKSERLEKEVAKSKEDLMHVARNSGMPSVLH